MLYICGYEYVHMSAHEGLSDFLALQLAMVIVSYLMLVLNLVL